MDGVKNPEMYTDSFLRIQVCPSKRLVNLRKDLLKIRVIE